MALQENDDFVPSISVEAPPDDPYGLIQSTTNSADDDDFLRDATAADYFKDALLSSSLYSPTSPSSDGYLPSSPDSLYSLTSSLDSPWYSPQGSPYQLSATESPYPTSLDDFPDFAPPTVAPRDITSSTFDSSFLDASAVHEGAAHSMEPLFEEGFEDAQDQDLVALDGLDSHGTMSSTLFSPEVTDLRISIPVAAPSSRPPSPVPHYSPVPSSGVSEAPKTPAPDKPSRSLDHPDIPSRTSEASYSNSSPSSSSTPPVPLPTRSTRRNSASSGSPLRVASSPGRVSPRRHPYPRKLSDSQYAAAAAEALMSLEGYIQVVSILGGIPEFASWDFESGFPPLVKPTVGSDQTRKASQERRTDTSIFSCPLPDCGSTVTKKHNLKHHLESHFINPIHQCPICNRRISHQASLQRHIVKLHDGPGSGTRVNKGKKLGKRH